MRANSIALGLISVCAFNGWGQTPVKPHQDQTFTFAHAESIQQVYEIVLLIRSITDAPIDVTDETQKMRVRGSPDQLALAGWLFNELDKPGNQQPPSSESTVPLEYRMPGADDVVRIFYVPFAESIQDFQEIVTLVRSTTDI